MQLFINVPQDNTLVFNNLESSASVASLSSPLALALPPKSPVFLLPERSLRTRPTLPRMRLPLSLPLTSTFILLVVPRSVRRRFTLHPRRSSTRRRRSSWLSSSTTRWMTPVRSPVSVVSAPTLTVVPVSSWLSIFPVNQGYAQAIVPRSSNRLQ